jgi:hypothetical protein
VLTFGNTDLRGRLCAHVVTVHINRRTGGIALHDQRSRQWYKMNIGVCAAA